ncbi:hypothetical protein LT706_18005 [Pseudomonas syringae pv. syringae]|uniref:hypothetical protein n=1 Tax=Pseudomonas syringae TaxID=317 RepID=UPI000465A167|nr:hypothetical protein [Pseudomonas syringae]KPB26152.1 Uncharacterized protein AC517_4771 [Pseudomonas syringae pv. syringae]MCK9713406.1 hypothetical protein [Pseudomonas syringae pv. syringae]MCK9717660.1 hypothetical protein [Pseudomonas syringae pv. syringae]MCK9763080.1 hypothetical protein [Pseudomonas syringae pv. syringae]
MIRPYKIKGMSVADLVEALDWLPKYYGHLDASAEHRVPDKYYSPGFIAAFAAYLTYKRVNQDSVVFDNENHEGYFSAVGLAKAVWGVDDYLYERRNAGVNYAPLTPLASQDDVDKATAQINSCLRSFAKSGPVDYGRSPAFKELTHVVGEMHDNVWSHGLNTGFSIAQRHAIRNGHGHVLEFSLADCGMGFLEELKRSRIAGAKGIQCDRDAVEWCVQEGNSSKLAKLQDEWAQSVPEDHLGTSPFGGVGVILSGNGNHHQGLGLAKLVELAKSYEGVLNIASGDCLMMLRRGVARFRTLSQPWRGVAVSLSIKESSFMAAKVDEAEDVQDIMKLLRG